MKTGEETRTAAVALNAIRANCRACADLTGKYWKVVTSLTLAWSWISAFCWGGVVKLEDLAPQGLGYQSLFFMACSASTVTATICVLVSRRNSYDQLPPWVHMLTLAIMALGSAIISLVDTVLPWRSLYIAGSILIGVGGNLAYWLWAHLLTRFSSREVLLFMSIAMLGSALYDVLLSSMDPWLSHTLITLTPAAVVGLHVSYENGLPSFQSAPMQGGKLDKTEGRTFAMAALFFVLTAAVGLTFGLMDGMAYSEDGTQGGTGTYAIAAAIASILLVGLIVVFYGKFVLTLVGLVLFAGLIIIVTSLSDISWTYILHFGTVLFYPLLWSFCTEFGRARAHRASYFMTGFLVYELAQVLGVILKDTVLAGFDSIGNAMGLSCIYLILTVVMVWLLSSSLLRKSSESEDTSLRCTAIQAIDEIRNRCSLTERETEVLKMLSDDLPIDQAAEKLCVSVQTLRTHIKHVYAKLEVHSRQEAMDRVEVCREELTRSLIATHEENNPVGTWL